MSDHNCSPETQQNIGELRFCICNQCRLGRGSYGFVFKGKFECDVPVAVKRVDKTEIEEAILRKANNHQNIVRYYITKEDNHLYLTSQFFII